MEVRITGGKQLHDLLQQLPVEVETKILRAAMGRAAGVIRDEARSRAPIESGKLRKAIKSSRKTKAGQVIAKVKLLGEHSYIGYFQEYGVKPHLVSRGDGALTARSYNNRLKKGGGVTQLDNGLIRVGGYSGTKTVHTKNGPEERAFNVKGAVIKGAKMHPGHAARPFMRPALDAKADAALSILADYMTKYLAFGTLVVPSVSVDVEGEE